MGKQDKRKLYIPPLLEVILTEEICDIGGMGQSPGAKTDPYNQKGDPPTGDDPIEEDEEEENPAKPMTFNVWTLWDDE